MPIIMKGGRLITVPHLKSDKKKPVAAPSNVKPETIEEEIVAQNTEAANSEVITELPSIHEGKTVPQLKELLKENKIEFPSSAKKADLVELADTIEDDSEEV